MLFPNNFKEEKIKVNGIEINCKYTKNSDLNYRIIFYKTKKYILSKSLL